jgi:hypothetical protein
MKRIDLQEFSIYLDEAGIKKKLKNELKFIQSTEDMGDDDWSYRELLAIPTKNDKRGILIVSFDEGHYLIPYELKSGIISATTGRSQSIICDFCRTWQNGSNSGSITFQKDRMSNVSYLCCADLKCSLHVRTLTAAAHTSRAQIREDLTNEQRIERLLQNLHTYLSELPVVTVRI